MPRYTGSSDRRTSALCAQTDPELWFPEPSVNGGPIAAAKSHRYAMRSEKRVP